MSVASKLLGRPQPDDSQGLASVEFFATDGVTKTLPASVVCIPKKDKSLNNVFRLNPEVSRITCYYVIGPWFEDDTFLDSCTKVNINVYRFTRKKRKKKEADKKEAKTFLIDKNDFSNIVLKNNFFVIPLLSDKKIQPNSQFLKEWCSSIVICPTAEEMCKDYREYLLYGLKKEKVDPPRQPPQVQRSPSCRTSDKLFKYHGFHVSWNNDYTDCYVNDMNTLVNEGMIHVQDDSSHDHHYKLLGYYKKHQDGIQVYCFCSEGSYNLHANPCTPQLGNYGNNDDETGIPAPNSEPSSLQTTCQQGSSLGENIPGASNDLEQGDATNRDQPGNNSLGLRNDLEQGNATNRGQLGNNSLELNNDQQGNNNHERNDYSGDQRMVVDSGLVERTSRLYGSPSTLGTRAGLPESSSGLQSSSQSMVTGRPASTHRQNNSVSSSHCPQQIAPRSFEELLLVLAKQIAKDWRGIGVLLGFQHSDLETIDADFKRIEDKTYDMLNKWKQRMGGAATPQALKIVLTRAGRTDLADIVQGLIPETNTEPNFQQHHRSSLLPTSGFETSHHPQQTGDLNGHNQTPRSFEELLLVLARHIATDWRGIGVFLGFQNNDLTIIDANSTQIQDKTYDMLSKWKQRMGSAATPQELETALRHAGRTDLANIVQGFIRRPTPHQT